MTRRCAQLAAWLALGIPVAGQTVSEPVRVVEPITSVRSATAVSFPEGYKLTVQLWSTFRLPDATGEAKIERKKGVTEVEAELRGMKPASLFGGDFSTYVLWIVSPEGQLDNGGEIVLDGRRAKLKVSTPLQTFGLFVTAEPHYLVSSPSRFIVLDSGHPPPRRITEQAIERANINYRGSAGIYEYKRETLAEVVDSELAGESRPDVRQARSAVRLAERAGAAKYAADEFAAARTHLQQLETLAERGFNERQLTAAAHNVVRAAVKAQKLARQRTLQAALETERRIHADQLAATENSLRFSEAQADRAAEEARLCEARLVSERRARQQTAEQLRQAKFRAESEAAQRDIAEQRESEIRERWQRDRNRLRNALGSVADTRHTARGLIVSLPDILFDPGRATLKPQAREVLSKLCGILLVTRDNALSIEGHSDSVGSAEYNQQLSERRAEAVRDYLGGCGVEGGRMRALALGDSQPIASNDTAAGRRQNRRVEIVIEDSPQIAAGRRP